MVIFVDAPFSLGLTNQDFMEKEGERIGSTVRWEDIPAQKAAACLDTVSGVLRIVTTREELEGFRRESAANQSICIYLVSSDKLGIASYTFKGYIEKHTELERERESCREMEMNQRKIRKKRKPGHT